MEDELIGGLLAAVEVAIGRLGGLLRVLPMDTRVDEIVGFVDVAKLAVVTGLFGAPVVVGLFGGTVDFVDVILDPNSELSFDIESTSD